MRGLDMTNMDSAKAAGLMVLGAIVVLGVTRKAFGGVRIALGD